MSERKGRRISLSESVKVTDLSGLCSFDLLVGLVEFVLPLELAVHQHAVVPQHQAAWDSLVDLVRQVAQEQRGVFHGHLLPPGGDREIEINVRLAC